MRLTNPSSKRIEHWLEKSTPQNQKRQINGTGDGTVAEAELATLLMLVEMALVVVDMPVLFLEEVLVVLVMEVMVTTLGIITVVVAVVLVVTVVVVLIGVVGSFDGVNVDCVV